MQKWVVPAGIPLTKFSIARVSGRKLSRSSSSQADSAVETSMSNSANEDEDDINTV